MIASLDRALEELRRLRDEGQNAMRAQMRASHLAAEWVYLFEWGSVYAYERAIRILEAFVNPRAGP